MSSNGRIRKYFWEIKSLLSRKSDLLDEFHHDYSFPEDDFTFSYTHFLGGCIVFKGGSKLRFQTVVDFDAQFNVVEVRYYYGYFSRDGRRIFQYDNAPHHTHLSTHPHHMHKGPRPKAGKDGALPSDIVLMSFQRVLEKVEELLQSQNC